MTRAAFFWVPDRVAVETRAHKSATHLGAPSLTARAAGRNLGCNGRAIQRN